MAKSLDEFMDNHIGAKPKQNSHHKGHHSKTEDKKRKSSEPYSESHSSGVPSSVHSSSCQDNEIQSKRKFKEDLQNPIELGNCWSISSNEGHKTEEPVPDEGEITLNELQSLKSSSENLMMYMKKCGQFEKPWKLHMTNSGALEIVSQLNKHRRKLLQTLSQLDKC